MQTEWTCIYCGGQGKVKYPRASGDIEKPALIICSNCSKPSAYVWCDKCEMGGAIAETEFVDSPNYWICIQCGSKHQLPERFYDTSFDFNPTKLKDPEWQKEKFIIRTKRHITVRWIRNTILFFERNEKNLIGVPVALAGISIVGILIMSQFLDNNSSVFSSLFVLLFFGSLSLLLLQVLIWVVLSLISGLFLTAYRVRRFWR
jgi:hypothetical protein